MDVSGVRRLKNTHQGLPLKEDERLLTSLGACLGIWFTLGPTNSLR